MKLKLPDSVSSRQDLLAVQQEVRDYARWMAHEAIKRKAGSKHSPEPPATSKATAELLRQWSAGGSVSSRDFDQLVTSLADYAKSAPSLTITVAAPPTASLKASLVSWCRSNLRADVLVSFEFNATLLGGMVVRTGSHVYDWSLRRQLFENRQAFAEVLRRV